MTDPRPTPDAAAAPDRPETEALLRRLTGSLAHNLNNRLTGVIASLELGLTEAPPESPLGEHLRTGLDCAWQAAELLRRVVAFAFRPDAPLDAVLVNLGELATNTARRVRERSTAALTIAVSAVPVPLVHVNPLLLQLAVDQLVNNAVEAMPWGGTLILQVNAEGDDVWLRVSDTGPGLPVEVSSRLFEPFVTTKTAGHLGLGLVLCRDLTEAMGGRLDLTWGPGGGTTATLSFVASSESVKDRTEKNAAVVDPPAATLAPMWHVI